MRSFDNASGHRVFAGKTARLPAVAGRRLRRGVFALLTVLLCLFALALPAQAAETPYKTYDQDKWGNASAAPSGYIPTRSLGGSQLGCGDFSNPQDLFYCAARGEVYVVDSGNARILVLNEAMEFQYELTGFSDGATELVMKNPQGIFVQEDGTVYVADMGLQQVFEARLDGSLVRILPTPQSSLLPDNFNYLPIKVVVDAAGRIYILSRGIYQGLIYLDPDGNFIKFFGPNNVEMTLQRRIQQLWKSILPDKAAATMQSFNPIEYSNIYLSADGYIYATAAGSENGAAVYTKLNPLGIDVNPMQLTGSFVVYADVLADPDGTVTLLNTQRGQIFQYNEESGTMLFNFGGIGKQLGLFQKPVSLMEVGGKIYVLDADKKTITEFVLSEYGELVRKATALYAEGFYLESIEPWNAVLRRDANYLPAYLGLGKAYYQLKDYKTAMYYFGTMRQQNSYSMAWKEYSLAFMRQYFTWIVVGLIAFLIALPFLIRGLRALFQKLFEKLRERLKKKTADPAGNMNPAGDKPDTQEEVLHEQ